MLHYYLTFSFHLKLALLTQLTTSNERKIPPHLKIKPAKFHNGGFTQDLYMHICSISVKFLLWKNSMNALKSVARTQRVNAMFFYCSGRKSTWWYWICRRNRCQLVGQYLSNYFSRKYFIQYRLLKSYAILLICWFESVENITIMIEEINTFINVKLLKTFVEMIKSNVNLCRTNVCLIYICISYMKIKIKKFHCISWIHTQLYSLHNWYHFIQNMPCGS